MKINDAIIQLGRLKDKYGDMKIMKCIYDNLSHDYQLIEVDLIYSDQEEMSDENLNSEIVAVIS